MIKRLAAFVAALGLMLVVTAPAFANDLHQTVPEGGIVAGDFFNADECTGVTLDSGQVLWHFVHTMTSSADLPSTLTATFSDGSSQTVDGYVNGNSEVMYDVYTSDQVNLMSASDTITNDGLLNLSHTCVNPGQNIPEAPAAALLVLTAGLAGLGFVALRMRQSGAAA